MRKSEAIRRLEEAHGRPAEEVVVEAINTHGSMSAAARALGVSANTLYFWVLRLHIEVNTTARVHPGYAAAVATARPRSRPRPLGASRPLGPTRARDELDESAS